MFSMSDNLENIDGDKDIYPGELEGENFFLDSITMFEKFHNFHLTYPKCITNIKFTQKSTFFFFFQF